MSRFAWCLTTAAFMAVALMFIGFAAYARLISIPIGDARVGLDTRNWSFSQNVSSCECTGCYIYVGPFFKRWS